MTSPSASLLIVTPDRALQQELQALLDALEGVTVAAHVANDLRQGAEAARSRMSRLVIVEMTADIGALRGFAQEVLSASPETVIAAVFRPESFGSDVSESALLIEALRAGVRDFLRQPVSAGELRELIVRAQATADRGPRKSGRIVSFISNKGGVGKSTTAVNAACGLALRHPENVLLVDASLQMGVCASMLNVTPETTITDAARERQRLDSTLLRRLATPHSRGLHLLAAPTNAVEAAEVDDDGLSRVLTVARKTYDYVLVDTFPLFDKVVLAALDLSDLAFIVMENVVPTLLGGVKFLELLQRLGFPQERERIVLNRFTRVPGSLSPREIVERFGRPVPYVLPYSRRVLASANTGVPHILRANRLWGYGPGIRKLVREIEALAEKESAPRNGQARHSKTVDQPERTA